MDCIIRLQNNKQQARTYDKYMSLLSIRTINFSVVECALFGDKFFAILSGPNVLVTGDDDALAYSYGCMPL